MFDGLAAEFRDRIRQSQGIFRSEHPRPVSASEEEQRSTIDLLGHGGRREIAMRYRMRSGKTAHGSLSRGLLAMMPRGGC